MANVEILLERNARLRAGEVLGATERVASTIVLTCVDPRVHPVHVLGLAPGEAAVLRNPGGRVNAGLIEALELLAFVGSSPAPASTELVIMHHSDCGLSHLGPQHASRLAAYFGTTEEGLAERFVGDPVASVRFDVELLARSGLTRQLVVSGLAYDVDSRAAVLVVPPVATGAGR